MDEVPPPHTMCRSDIQRRGLLGKRQTGQEGERCGEAKEGPTHISPEHEDHSWLPYEEARALLDKPSLLTLLEKAWLRVGEGT